jgi:hypothetical protein
MKFESMIGGDSRILVSLCPFFSHQKYSNFHVSTTHKFSGNIRVCNFLYVCLFRSLVVTIEQPCICRLVEFWYKKNLNGLGLY